MKVVKRPWGWFKQFVLNKKCTVKILELKAEEELSLQVHKRREEQWYFFDNAVVQMKNKKIKVKEGDLVKIGKRVPHRILAGKKKTRVLEVSFGDFEEKDEVRIEDKYGR